MNAAESPGEPICSRAECHEPAAFTVNWRNPKIHGSDRVKVWHACAGHVGYLGDYLRTRGFPVVVAPLGTLVTVIPDAMARS